jgi:hypothetical protein
MTLTKTHTNQSNVKWLDKPEPHDYPAATDYLELLVGPETAINLTKRLIAGNITHKKAKDILRAAQLTLLPKDNPHVAADLNKIRNGQPLAPVLLIRGDLTTNRPLHIADGYHRICATYHTDENTNIPAVIATPDWLQ